jgi:cell division protein FtsZ
VQKAVAEDAQIIWGTVIRPEQQEDIVITVIATGFEEKTAAAVRPPVRAGRHTQAPAPVNYDIPTVERNRGLKKAVGMDFTVLESDLDSADLDIPTFLRRQAD